MRQFHSIFKQFSENSLAAKSLESGVSLSARNEQSLTNNFLQLRKFSPDYFNMGDSVDV